MLKSLFFAIGGSVAISILSLNPAAKAEPDYLCYMRKPTGQTVDLSKICGSSTTLSAAVMSPQAALQQPTNPDEGGISLVSKIEFRKDSGSPFWFVLGTMRNDTNQPVSEVKVTLVVNGKLTTGSLYPRPLKPREVGTFEALFAQHERPLFAQVDTVVWKREDGSIATSRNDFSSAASRESGSSGSGRCNYPTDLDINGRPCGKRAASERPGGR